MVKSPAVLSALLTAFLIYSGLVHVCPRHDVRSMIPSKNITRISGKIASSPAKSSSGSTYSMMVELSDVSGAVASAPASGRIKLFVPAADVEALYPGKLYSSSENRSQGTRNQADRNGKKGNEKEVFIYETGAFIQAEVSFIENKAESTVPCTIEPLQYYSDDVLFSGWQTSLDYMRALLRLQLKRILSAWKEAGGLLLALVCGAREYTEKNVSDSFREAGLSHILALSGMHLSLFASLTEKTAGRALGKKLEPLLNLAASGLFVWFAGASPSLVRALICMVITSLADISSIKITVLEKVSLSFLIHICLFPEDAGSAAFMLSYGALIGLYYGDCYVKPLISRFLPPAVASSVSASAGAQLLTAPVSLILFGECRPGGVVASVIISPLASWFVTGGICALITVLILPFLLKPVGVIMNYLYTLIRQLVTLFARIPGIDGA